MNHLTIRLPIVASACLVAFGPAFAHSEPENFAPTAFIAEPETVDCTLEDGTASHCHQITVGYLPEGLEIGPFCPATLDDEGGVWEWTGENSGLYRINGDFLRMLDTLGYRFFDDDGNVYTVDNATEQPTVDHACINVSVDESVEITMLLPIDPVLADAPTQLGTVGKVGVALDGVPIFSDAPQIQVTGHMPALDTCGGHVDPGGWYHWHATSTDVATVYENEDVKADCALEQDARAQFGYAFDGFALYGSLEADGSDPVGLDQCNGHVGASADGSEEYHYHSSKDFPNLPPCLVGLQAEGNFTTTATAGVGAQRAGEDGRNEAPRPGGRGADGMPPGFEEAATSLGVSSEDLLNALGGPGQQPDFSSAAKLLDVSEDALRAALPPPPNQ